MNGPPAGEGAFEHRPVMLAEVLELFEPLPAGIVVDATVGGAGHAAAILDRFERFVLLGIDQDADAVVAAERRLARFGARARVRHARFDELRLVVGQERDRFAIAAGGPASGGPGLGVPTSGGGVPASGEPGAGEPGAEVPEMPVVAVLFDLGVSSPQLDQPGRGFSYRQPGPLDMRMDRGRGRPAADLVNGATEDELVRLFAAHGEQRFARRIARAILAARPIGETTALAEVVASAVPAAARRRGHPARRVFQALRVAVNEELDVLPGALDDAISLLAPYGRCVVLAYHSGEDRIVKAHFREAATGGCTCPPGLPCVCGAAPVVRLLRRGARQPSAEEVAANPRAEAARLRAVERLAPAPAPEPEEPR